jgi:hypothetical protein
MSFADNLIDQARAHQDIFIAGVQAANENSPSARKLARLITACETVVAALDEARNMDAAVILDAAIAEARR